VIEDGELRWDKTFDWRVPEGLGDIVAPYVEKPGTVSFTQVVKP
jgi:hypothetical protein